MNINRALRDERLMKGVTGMSIKGFNELLKDFKQNFEKEKRTNYNKEVKKGKRERKPGGGRKGRLETLQDKLFFTLFYFKCYPTFDVLGFVFDFDRSNACRNVQNLIPILEKTLGEAMVLPKRKIRTMDELFELFPEVNDLIIDGTERQIPRPKDNEKQKRNYSGKKKRHTKKNTIIADEDKQIRYLGPTVEGKKHDYGAFKEEFPTKPPPDLCDSPGNNRCWTDLGFIGMEKDYPGLNVIMPKKKPKG